MSADAPAQPETCYRHPDQETLVHCTRCGRPICPDCMTPAPVGHHCPECVKEGRRSTPRVRRRIPKVRSVTTLLLVLNVAVFAIELMLGAAQSTVLIRMGAMVPVLVAQGEYWRLITATFLHAGLLHLGFNMLVLYIFGNLLEPLLGPARMAAVYLVSGFVASAVSFAFGDVNTIAVGASGAVFGLLGAWLAYNLRRRSLSLARSNVQGVLILIGINLVFGFAVPGIDNLAHIGGLVCGFLAGWAIEGVGRRPLRLASQVVGLAVLVAAGIGLTAWRISQLVA